MGRLPPPSGVRRLPDHPRRARRRHGPRAGRPRPAARIDVHRCPEEGEYLDGAPGGRACAPRARSGGWTNAEWRATLKGKALDPDRAYAEFRRIPEVLAPYAAGDRGRGWVRASSTSTSSCTCPAAGSIRALAREATVPRLRFLNFNVGHDRSRPGPAGSRAARPALGSRGRRPAPQLRLGQPGEVDGALWQVAAVLLRPRGSAGARPRSSTPRWRGCTTSGSPSSRWTPRCPTASTTRSAFGTRSSPPALVN